MCICCSLVASVACGYLHWYKKKRRFHSTALRCERLCRCRGFGIFKVWSIQVCASRPWSRRRSDVQCSAGKNQRAASQTWYAKVGMLYVKIYNSKIRTKLKTLKTFLHLHHQIEYFFTVACVLRLPALFWFSCIASVICEKCYICLFFRSWSSIKGMQRNHGKV